MKLASRSQLSRSSCLELGIGAADDSIGKSLVRTLSFTVGTVKDKPWNYYFSLRFAYAKGSAGNVLTLPSQKMGTDSNPPPNTSFLMLNLGTQGEIRKIRSSLLKEDTVTFFPKA